MTVAAKAKGLIVGLLVACALVVALPAARMVALGANSHSTDISFVAGLYNSADRTDDSLRIALTDEGATLTGWEFSNTTYDSVDLFLGVNLSGLDMSKTKQYRLVIEMDPVLYINQTTAPSLANTEVSFKQNDPLTVNTDASYTVKKYSLENLTYLIDTGSESLTLGLPVRFDAVLWNKQDGGALGNGEDPLLRVYLEETTNGATWTKIDGCDANLLQATVAGSLAASPTFNTYIVGGSGASTVNIGLDDELELEILRISQSSYSGKYFNESIEIEIVLPEVTVGDKTYRMGYRDFSFATTGGSSEYISSSEDGVIRFSADNFLFKNADLATTYLSLPDDIDTIPGGTYSLSGSVSVWIDGQLALNKKSLKITLDAASDAILSFSSTGGEASIVDVETVQPLGKLGLQNKAAFANGSGPLQIELNFDVNNTKAVAVSTVNLMCDRASETITIWYTLVDFWGNPVYVEDGVHQEFSLTVANPHYKNDPTATVGYNNLLTFSRNDLQVEEHRQYYFKSIRYTMGNLPGGCYAFHTGASLAPYGAATFWGYLTSTTIPSVKPKHTIDLYEVHEGGELVHRTDLNLTSGSGKNSCVTTINDGTKVSYGITGAYVSASTVDAGDSVVVGGRLYVMEYPYSSSHCLDNVRIGLRLPEGITVNESSITATYTGGNLQVESVTRTPIADDPGYYFWIIQLEEGRKIGWYNEALDPLDTGDRITFRIQLNTAYTLSTQTLNLREFLVCAGEGSINSAGGSNSGYAVLDVYDLNGNGSKADNIACFPSTVKQSITFQAAEAKLEITDSLTNEKGDTGSEVNMESFADIINYKLTVKCVEGGHASGFYYLIPVPTAENAGDPNFVSQCQVDVFMSGAPTVVNQSGTPMMLLFTTEPVTSYDAAIALGDACWSTTLPEGKTYADVTMMKVISEEGVIENGSITTISVPLSYAGLDTDYNSMAGYKISWKSRGYYRYVIGANAQAGIRSTDGTTITLTYTRQEPIEFSLTAAKGGTPSVPGSQTYSFVLPQFILAQTYSVKQVTPYNVNLMKGSYNFANASSSEANENFRIKVSVKKAEGEEGSTPVAIEKGGEIIGSLAGNTAPEFTFTIENADALSDIVTERYVTLILIGSNGVIVPVKITVKREMAPAEPTASVIAAGELYSPFDSGATSTTVSNDSAFTAQFVTQYIPGNYTDRKIVFNKVPAAGTVITMIDWTNARSVSYSRYVVKSSDTGTIKLSQFIKMGSQTAKYAEPTTTDLVTERLLFVVDFPDGGEAVRDNSLTLMKTIKTGTDDTQPAVLSFTTVAKRSFGLSTSSTSVKQGDTFTISYNTNCSVTDSRFTGRNFALVVSAANGSTISDTACLTVRTANGTSRYYLNSDGQFIVPLTAVQKGAGEIDVSFDAGDDLGTKLVFNLWASATASGSLPLMGEKVSSAVNVTVASDVMPSLKVTGMAPGRMLTADELSSVQVSYQAKNIAKNTASVRLQQKVGFDYVTQTSYLGSVNGNSNANMGQGAFAIPITSGTIELKLSALTEPGTYRLQFQASSSTGETISVVYGFVVLED